MPPFEAFRDAEGYYATLSYETAHWAGSPERQERGFGRKRFGDRGYAQEELAANLGIELESELITAPIIASWLEVFRNDKWAIFRARRGLAARNRRVDE